jgi:hypothetical protein
MVITPALLYWNLPPQSARPPLKTEFKTILLVGITWIGVLGFAYLLIYGKMDAALSSVPGRFALLFAWLMIVGWRWQALYRET